MIQQTKAFKLPFRDNPNWTQTLLLFSGLLVGKTACGATLLPLQSRLFRLLPQSQPDFWLWLVQPILWRYRSLEIITQITIQIWLENWKKKKHRNHLQLIHSTLCWWSQSVVGLSSQLHLLQRYRGIDGSWCYLIHFKPSQSSMQRQDLPLNRESLSCFLSWHTKLVFFV